MVEELFLIYDEQRCGDHRKDWNNCYCIQLISMMGSIYPVEVALFSGAQFIFVWSYND